MTEVIGQNLTARADGDEPGDQYRVYEFAGMAHVDSRDSVRFKPNPCEKDASQLPRTGVYVGRVAQPLRLGGQGQGCASRGTNHPGSQ